MNRISNEDGINAGARNIGRFFLAMIPWAIAVGLMAWLGAWIAFHEWQRELRQDKRSAVYVAAPEPVKSRIKITPLNNRSCVKVDRADLDGNSLIMYGRAPIGCSSFSGTDYAEWHWQELSPDGTIIHQDWTNSIELHEGTRAEGRFKVPIDDRTSEIQIWIERSQ